MNAQLPATTNGPRTPATAIASPLKVMAGRFSIEPIRLLEVLKATVIKPDKHGHMASDEEIAAFVIVANEYGLNPLTKELHAFVGQSGAIVPIVGIDGWTRIVNRHADFDGVEFAESQDEEGRPISTTCIMHVKGRAYPIKVTEWYSECKRTTIPWQTMPRRMLRHKAFMQAARLCFGLSGIYDEDEGRDIQRNQPALVEQPPEPLPQPRRSRVSQRDPEPQPEPEPAGEQQPPETVAAAAIGGPPVIDQGELSTLDDFHDLDDRIRETASIPVLDEIGRELATKRQLLGESQYQTLLFRQQARRRELAPDVRRKTL